MSHSGSNFWALVIAALLVPFAIIMGVVVAPFLLPRLVVGLMDIWIMGRTLWQ